MEPGDTPADNTNFLFFCTAVIQAVNKHQGLLRASVANIGQDHRLGANEAPPAIISIFLGAELEKAFDSIASGSGDGNTEAAVLELGSEVLPHLPMHGGDRNRTSPFAFTGNKFEFRALGSSMSLGFPNTVLNTIVAEAIDELSDQLEAKLNGGGDVAAAVAEVVAGSYNAQQADHLRWRQLHRRVARRGGEPRAQEPAHHARRAARGDLGSDRRGVRASYNVLSERELHSRYEVWLEQYVTRANIEAETTESIARTMILPAALRHLALIDAAGVSSLAARRPRAGRHSDRRARRALRRRTSTRTVSRGLSSRSTRATTSSTRWRRCARRPTLSSGSWPTTSGRCRSTRRSCSSSSA